MHAELSNALYHIIQQNREQLNASPEFPFLSMELVEMDHLIAESKSPLPQNTSLPEQYIPFKQINAQHIINMRTYLHVQGPQLHLLAHVIRMHRHIEIQYGRIYQHERQYGRSAVESMRIFNQALALFTECSLKTGDVLLLNTALKIADLKTFVPEQKQYPALYVIREIKLMQMTSMINDLRHG